MSGDLRRYDVCLSFAGEDRAFVEHIADKLRERAVRVFYDRYERANLWGKDLYAHLASVYSDSRYCVIFVSVHYARKLWPNHELRSAQERAFKDVDTEYILPIRLDDTTLPGIRATVGYLDAKDISKDEIVEMICQKLSGFDVLGELRHSELDWAAVEQVNFSNQVLQIRKFQATVVGTPVLEPGSLNTIIDQIYSSTVFHDEQAHWSCAQNRYFDQVYATSSLVTAFSQWGLDTNDQLYRVGVDFLLKTNAASIDDRAATIALMVLGRLDPDSAEIFVDELVRLQILDPVSPDFGSFLFYQGPAPSPTQIENWTEPIHRDGASFHACHIADALLHTPQEYVGARAKAFLVLQSTRRFFHAAYREHEGWLVNILGERSNITLFSYAIAPALRIPLPNNWREIARSCRDNSVLEGTLRSALGVTNATYSARRISDEDYRKEVRNYAARWLHDRDVSTDTAGMDIPALAAYMRAILYCFDFVEPAAGASLRQEFRSALVLRKL
jgi:hypothetical protein